jgi:ferritin-like metal-binding protein YciE
MEKHTLLEAFFKNALQDIYYAEKQLVKALEKMENEATTDELKEAFRNHRTETEGHVDRLEEVFDAIGEEAKTQKCEAIEGIIKEAGTIIDETKEDTYTRDVALVFAAQKAEHYEIATYGALITLAEQLDLDQVADILSETLEEEKGADQTLTEIAENYLYQAAKTEG